MVKIDRFVVGALATNCYLLVCDQEAIVVDPGEGADMLTEEIARRNLQLRALWATHGHFDHLLAVPQLQLVFGVPLYLHTKDRFLANELAGRAGWWLKQKIELGVIREIREIGKGMKLTIGESEWDVLETPGHTPGGVCFWSKQEGVLLTGDTLFAQGVGRTDLSYSSPKALANSLKKLKKLPPQTRVLPGHGEETILKIH